MASAIHNVGEAIFLDSVSPTTKAGVVFEEDGEAGYFYALDTSLKDQQILDALHVYNVEDVIDRFKPSSIRILWSGDGLKAALLINDQFHAVFDFTARQGWCRSGFPPSRGEWSKEGHEWDEDVVDLFD